MNGLDQQALQELRGELRQLLSDSLDARRYATGDQVGVAYNGGKADAFRHALGIIQAVIEDQAQRERLGA